MSQDIPVRSVKKALDLLTILAFEDVGREGIALTTLAQRMEIPANSAHNLLKTMAACHYVGQTEAGAYCVGPRIVELGRLNLLLSAAASPELRRRMDALCVAVDEAVTLATLVNGRRLLLCRADPRQVIRVDSAVLESRSLFAMPTGRVLAAFASPTELADILKQSGMPGADWNEITTRNALDRALAAIRKQGCEVIAPDQGSLAAFAVPVLDHQGLPLAALGCYAPLFRCGPEKHAAVLDALRQTARDLVHVL